MRTTLKITGYLVMAIGVVGLASPASMGAHAGVSHNVAHLGAGFLALYFARRADPAAVRSFSVLFGLAYALIGAAGFLLGAPGSQLDIVAPLDPRLLKLIPGVLELGSSDHAVHLLTGLACFFAGLRGRREKIPVIPRERESALR